MTGIGARDDHAEDGETGLAMALEGIYDALILDRRLPALDGVTLVRRLRRAGAAVPVLMLSAIGSSATGGGVAGRLRRLLGQALRVQRSLRAPGVPAERTAHGGRQCCVLPIWSWTFRHGRRHERASLCVSSIASSCC